MLNELRDEVHALALSKGWYQCRGCDGSPLSVRGGCTMCNNAGSYRNPAELIALVHSELSEALEALREGNDLSSDMVAVELADAIIRLLDICGYADIDIDSAVMEKHEKNKGRPIRHGKVF